MRREPGSGSSDPDPLKKLIEMQNATDSGSGRGLDPRIIPKLMRMHMNPDSWIRIQEFLCGPQISIGSVLYGTDPLLRIQSGYKLFLCKGNSASRASERTRECYALSHLRTMILPCRSGTSQTLSVSSFITTHTVTPLNWPGMEGHPFQPGL